LFGGIHPAVLEVHKTFCAAHRGFAGVLGDRQREWHDDGLVKEIWDTCYEALREVTSGFLRLKGQYYRFSALFPGMSQLRDSESETVNVGTGPGQYMATTVSSERITQPLK
jgi:hypothetical protein